MPRFAVFGGLVLVTALVTAQEVVPPTLIAMADAEREFARTATVKGWRDAFLDFFADDAVGFAPQVIVAKDRLRKQPNTPFSEVELLWEPRTGDVAASGELGWLTGPSTTVIKKTPEVQRRYGCYLSIWRKQPDGQWRVFIDVGVNAPEAATFAPGFNRLAFNRRYVSKSGDEKEAAGKALADVDRDLNQQIAAKGIPLAIGARAASAARLHRPGTVPLVGRDAIVKWLEANATTGTATHGAAEAAKSGDFGYTHGRFEVTADTPDKAMKGVYIRLWQRDIDGAWWLVADVAQTFKE
jgi:ketosteroid isomerase-like protein